jgi:prophage regulatory protein
MSHEQLSQLLNKSALCARLNISARTIENMVTSGKFPPPVRIGKCVYWSDAAVTKWQQHLFLEQERWTPVDHLLS